MKYFAYGSNMCTNRLRDRVPSCRFYTVATLKRYTLKFHKRSTDGSGKCNAYFTDDLDDYIIGVVFEIDEADKSDLDDAEGLGGGYNERVVVVLTAKGTMGAHMYIADPKAIDDLLTPYTWYKDFVVGGARQHELPEEYINRLETIEALVDPDKVRAERNSKVLPC